MAELKPVGETTKTKRGPGGKSDLAYPYFDLENSLAVARAVHEQGGGTCSKDHLAAALKYSTTKSGGFLARIYAAKTFGLIDFHADVVSLTDRARRILHPVMETDELAGRAEAFMAVPLFSRVFEQFRGGALPPDIGLQNFLRTQCGIVNDRVKPTMRILLDSAEQAGFFLATGDRTRMIAPNVSSTSTRPQTPPASSPDGEAVKSEPRPAYGGGEGGPPGVHPALIAILRELPRSGTEWPKAKKDRFIVGFRGILDIVYPDPEAQS